MKKYEALGKFLKEQWLEEVPVTFAKIEQIIGAKLPRSQRYPAWWSNSTTNNVMTRVWLDAGFRTERVDIEGKKLVFKRIARHATGGGIMSETSPDFRSEGSTEMRPRRSPLFGALKGTFSIEPGYDITSPMFNDEEWTEIEKEMNADWDQIEHGMSGGKK